MKKLLKEPLLHFLALGAVIFALNAWREKARPTEASAARIEVTAAVIERLRAGYERQFGQAPDAEELRGLVTAHIREEVLCREALALGLDRDDTIVRRRLAQKMEFLTDDIAGAAEPDDAAVREFFEKNAARYAKPARVSFRHVYFSKEKRGARRGGGGARGARGVGRKARATKRWAIRFCTGLSLPSASRTTSSRAFGPEFAKQLAAQPAGEWRGPVASSYGLHLVRVEARTEPRAVKFDEVRETVVRDFNDERRRTANREIFEKLRERYHVDGGRSRARESRGARERKRPQR